MKPLAPNTRLQDRYKITEMIGKGGMGEVYLAIDQRLGHSIALKRTTVGDDDLLTEAFEREARTLAQLRNSILPKVSDHFIESGEQYLVMEYISGDDLMERLKATNKAFPLNWVMFWADQILEALTYLHTYDPPIIHRDIKPQNLKLTSENHIVLLDFGLSKNAIGKTQVTSSGSVLGYTPHYASMEQVRGTGTNAKSDIFSLSATLYHLIANEPPPDALTRADARLSGLPDPLKPLTEMNPEVNETISNNILKGMEITQDKRFETARDMQKALRKAYNEMQSSMSAQTLAFNAQDIAIEDSTSAEIGVKTEVMSDLPLQTDEVSVTPKSSAFVSELTENDENLDPTLVGGFRPDDISAEKTEVINAEEFKAAVGDRDLNATVEFNAPFEDKATNITNEHIPAEIPSTSDLKATQDIPISESDFKTQDDISTNDDFTPENFKTAEEVHVQENLEPKPTTPLNSLENDSNESIQFEESNENIEGVSSANWEESFIEAKVPVNETEYNEVGKTSAGVEVTENLTNKDFQEALQENTAEEIEAKVEEVSSASARQSTTKNALPPKGKSSFGKYVAILGGLGAVLFLLIGGVLAFGYYYTNGSFSFGEDKTVTTEKEQDIENQQETTEPEVEANPEIVDKEKTEQTQVTTDSNDGKDNEVVTDGNMETTETTSTEDSSDSTEPEVTTRPGSVKTTKTTNKKTTTTIKPRTQITNKKPSIKTRTKTRTKANKSSAKKTKKPPVKKKTKKVKDAGVL